MSSQSEQQSESLWTSFYHAVRGITFDVIAVFLLLSIAIPAVLLSDSTVLHVTFGVLLLFVLPGYTLLIALFPRSRSSYPDLIASGRALTLRLRLVLSYGVSLVLVPGIGLAVFLFGPGFGTETLLASYGVLIATFTIVGELRRQRLPEAARFTPIRSGLLLSRGGEHSDFLSSPVNVLLVLVAVVAFSTLGYAVFVPNTGESYSNFQILTESESGELVASNYTTTLSTDSSESFAVAVDNHEDERTRYRIVAELQRIESSDDGAAVVEASEVTRLNATVGANDTWTARHSITPPFSGDGLRLTYYLYRTSPPEDPSAESAYRTVYLWVDVAPSSSRTNETRQTDSASVASGDSRMIQQASV